MTQLDPNDQALTKALVNFFSAYLGKMKIDFAEGGHPVASILGDKEYKVAFQVDLSNSGISNTIGWLTEPREGAMGSYLGMLGLDARSVGTAGRTEIVVTTDSKAELATTLNKLAKEFKFDGVDKTALKAMESLDKAASPTQQK